eukprot:gene1475-2101_t
MDEALPFVQRALEINQSIYGQIHPCTASSIAWMADILQAQGNFEAALGYLQRDFDIVEKSLGHDHPDTAASLNGLGVMMYRLGPFDPSLYPEALTVLNKSIAIRTELYGEEHEDVAECLNNKAQLLIATGEAEQAEEMHLNALDIRRKLLGDRHPVVAESLDHIAEMRMAQERTSEALQLFTDALLIREESLGKWHPDVANSLDQLAFLYVQMGHHSSAVPLRMRALYIYEEAFGMQNPKVMGMLESIAQFHEELGELEPALALYEMLVPELEASPTGSETSLVPLLHHMACLCQQSSDEEYGLELLIRAAEHAEDVESEDLAKIQEAISAALSRMGINTEDEVQAHLAAMRERMSAASDSEVSTHEKKTASPLTHKTASQHYESVSAIVEHQYLAASATCEQGVVLANQDEEQVHDGGDEGQSHYDPDKEQIYDGMDNEQPDGDAVTKGVHVKNETTESVTGIDSSDMDAAKTEDVPV